MKERMIRQDNVLSMNAGKPLEAGREDGGLLPQHAPGMDESVDVQWDAITSCPLVFHKGETFHGKPL
jgi:hypothetical protein